MTITAFRDHLARPRKHYLWIWFIWLGAFYSVWAWLVFGHGQWPVAKAHWPMALSMALGSYVAGSTPMGGGTVGFPVLVLFFKMPATLGRDFSFAIQAIGMVSAAIFIIVRRQSARLVDAKRHDGRSTDRIADGHFFPRAVHS